jgi:hypothetical protein
VLIAQWLVSRQAPAALYGISVEHSAAYVVVVYSQMDASKAHQVVALPSGKAR